MGALPLYFFGIMKRILGFDTDKYLQAQKKAIRKRMNQVGRLYLEFGGKLLADNHAARTLPGYDPQAKLRLLKELEKDMAIIYCVSAKQLADGKIRGDWGVGYDLATLKALKDLSKAELPVEGVVINRYEGESEAKIFAKRLKRKGIKVFKRKEIDEYPQDLDLILSPQGYGQDDYLKIDKPLIVVWGAGGGAGKLSTCLGQIYLDAQQGVDSGYAKLETFPVWDLSLDHPANVAYEASTADLGDTNMLDPFHLEAYDERAVNYNRDVEAFPIIKEIFNELLPKDNFCREYKSPTDMGVNFLSKGIIDDQVVRQAAKKEINFYLFRYRQEYSQGLLDKEVLKRMNLIMNKVNIGGTYLPPVEIARQARKEARKRKDKGDQGKNCGAAMELPNGEIVSGKNSPLLHAEAAVVLNALKKLSGIKDEHDLITKQVISQVKELKKEMQEDSYSLTCAETLLALSISCQSNPLAKKAQQNLKHLQNSFIHTTHIPSADDKKIFHKLNIWVSTDGN